MMKPVPLSAIRQATLLNSHTQVASLILQRSYATQHSLGSAPAAASGPKRRTVTPFNDDGHVPWAELSAGEKTARAAQQSFNFGMIIVGLVLTGGVSYFLYHEVFSPDSKVSNFNRAVDRIKKDRRCLELLGDSKKITAFGEETWNKWRRARPIASTERKDPQGNDHLMMQFNVEGPLNRGSVSIHLVKHAGHHEYEYKYFFVDVRGHQRIYLENADSASGADGGKRKTKLFGIQWSS